MKKPSPTTKHLIAYLAIGRDTALAELRIFQALITFFGVEVAVANVVALIVSTITNFCLNGFVNFKMTSNPL